MVSLLRFLWGLLGAGLTFVWRCTIVALPLLGVWLSSSIVAWFGGPRELALIGGLLLFPVLPLLWEWRGRARFARRVEDCKARGADPPRRFLRPVDRLVLRTTVVNGVFVVLLLLQFPRPAFSALATRGDWFLEGRTDYASEKLRPVVFAAAAGLEWLHKLANPNPYEKEGDNEPIPDDVRPTDDEKPDETRPDETGPDETRTGDTSTDDKKADDKKADDKTKPDGHEPTDRKDLDADATWDVGDTFWPHNNVVHPAVTALPSSVETSIEAVARAIAEQEGDPFQRVKAMHDWVVTRLHYDDDSLEPGQRKPQDARSVFTNRMGVCEGYARLLVAMGKVTGDDIRYIIGEVREPDGKAAVVGHAWNSVQIQGKWYFIDATWDDPSPADPGDAADNYRTDYLFTPPSVAIFDHLPKNPRWQLLADPISRGAFVRQPLTRPGLAKHGLALISPDRPLVDAPGAVDIMVDNPRGLHVMVVRTRAGQEDHSCAVDDDTTIRARCPLPQHGRYNVELYVNNGRYGSFDWIAQVGVNSR